MLIRIQNQMGPCFVLDCRTAEIGVGVVKNIEGERHLEVQGTQIDLSCTYLLGDKLDGGDGPVTGEIYYYVKAEELGDKIHIFNTEASLYFPTSKTWVPLKDIFIGGE